MLNYFVSHFNNNPNKLINRNPSLVHISFNFTIFLQANIEKRIREMQRKLSEIAEIPILLQNTLQAVSRTFDRFLSPEPEEKCYHADIEEIESNSKEPEIQREIQSDEEILPEPDYLDYNDFNIQPSESESFSEEEEEDNPSDDQIPELSIQVESESSTPEPTEEDLHKKEKMQKMQVLEQRWPWADRQKVIYKQSTCHLVPRLSIVEKRIKQLKDQNLFTPPHLRRKISR